MTDPSPKSLTLAKVPISLASPCGLRLGVAHTIIGVLLAEMFGSRLGIGFLLMRP